MAKKIATFDIITRGDGKLDYHLVGKNGEIIVQSTQGFRDITAVKRGIRSMLRAASQAEIRDRR